MIKPQYITCRELIDFIADYIDGSLTDAQRADFERHLGVCPSCVAYLDGYRHAARLASESLNEAPATDHGPVPEELIGAIRSARTRKG